MVMKKTIVRMLFASSLWVACHAETGSPQENDVDLQYIPQSDEELNAITAKMLATGTEVAYRNESEKQRLWIFEPQNLTPEELRPCLFFIHGGGWGGLPDAFAPQCLYFSRRGMVTVSIHFRGPKEPKEAGSPKTCLADARSAYRWIREHATEYHIDPDRIVVAGGSAGAHLALGLLTLSMDGIDNKGDPLSTPIDPKALILFNPAIDLVDGWKGGQKKCVAAGLDPKLFSPAHWVKPGMPDTLILSGSDDHVISPRMINDFVKRMEDHGNKATFIEYPDVGHGFFNYGKEKYNGAYFIPTCEEVDRFLTTHGFLGNKP